MNSLSESIKAYRDRKNLSQKALAEMLGVSQVYVSRLEKGSLEPSERLYAKIVSVIGAINDYHFKVEDRSFEGWRLASFVYPESGGDMIATNLVPLKQKVIAYHCDAAGSDWAAEFDARNVQVAIETILASWPENSITLEFIYEILSNLFRHSRSKLWRAEPSLNLIAINKGERSISVLNAGMPDFWIYRRTDDSFLECSIKRMPPIGRAKVGERINANKISFSPGDMLFSASDGFMEVIKSNGMNLSVYFRSFAKAQRSDATGVGMKIVQSLSETIKFQRLSDDMSFSIIAKSE